MSERKRQMEKEAKRVLKKLRKSAMESEETTTPLPSPPRRKFHGPTRPTHLPKGPEVIGPEIPDFLKKQESVEEEMVGPSLPAEEFDEGKSHDEVERIMKIFKTNESFVDPYEILQVDSKSTDSQVKKAFWKRSLAVHPDKSNHPAAHQAFQILNESWKKVQSAECRASWAQEHEKKLNEKQMELGMKKEQRKREWDAVLNPTKASNAGFGREEWMTELPELRRQPQKMKQVNQTSFSRKDYAAADQGVSEWTHQPMNSMVQGQRIPYQEKHDSLPDPVRSMKPSLLEQYLKSSTGDKKRSRNREVESVLKNTGSLHDRFG
eukprot:g6496.t1